MKKSKSLGNVQLEINTSDTEEPTLDDIPTELNTFFEEKAQKDTKEALKIYQELNKQLSKEATKVSKKVMTQVLGWTETLKNKELNSQESESLRDELVSMSAKINTKETEFAVSKSFGVANFAPKNFSSISARSGEEFQLGLEDIGSEIGWGFYFFWYQKNSHIITFPHHHPTSQVSPSQPNTLTQS